MDVIQFLQTIMSGLYNVLNKPIPITSDINITLWGIIIASLLFSLLGYVIHRLFE